MKRLFLIVCVFFVSFGMHDVVAKNDLSKNISFEHIGKEVSKAITSFWNGANPKSGQHIVVQVGKDKKRVDVIDTWLEQMTCITCHAMDFPLIPNFFVYHKERRIVRVPRSINERAFFSLVKKKTEAYVRERTPRRVHHIVMKRVDKRKTTVYVLYDMRPETQLDKAVLYAKYAAVGGASLHLVSVLQKINIRQLLVALAALSGTITSPYPEGLRVMGQLDFE